MAKGKKMGCSGAKKKEKSSYITKEIQELCNTEEFAETMKLVRTSLVNPGMELVWEVELEKE